MIEEVRLDKAALKERFGCSERLAVRIGALLSKGVGVTAALLEEAAGTKELETFLLSPAVLGGIEAALKKRAAEGIPLALVDTKGLRVLALEEETQAEQAWAAEAKLPAKAGGGPLSIQAGKLFSTDDIGRLKLSLLTGVEPSARIEALRKLALAPLPAEERGGLALHALHDADPQVRREAAIALERVGLNRNLAEALKDLSGGSEKQRELAFRKTASLAGKLKASERGVAASVLVSALSHEAGAAGHRVILESMRSFAAEAANTPEPGDRLARHLVRVLAEHPEALSVPVRDLLSALPDSKGLSSALWREVEGVGDRRLRIFWFSLLAGLELDAALEADLCRRAAEELGAGTVDDFSVRRLSDALARRGDSALQALLEVLPSASEDALGVLVGVIDAVASSDGVSAPRRKKAAEAFLRLLESGNRLIRTLIMESQLCGHPKVDASLRRRFALDFITNLHNHQAYRIHDLTHHAIRRIGLPAAEALRESLRKSSYPVERDAAAMLLGEISAGADDPAASTEIIDFLKRQESSDRIPAGVAIRAMGRACAGKGVPAPVVRGVYRELITRAGSREHSFEVLEALSWVASSPAFDPGAAADVVYRLLQILERPAPDIEVKEVPSDDGPRLSFGSGTALHLDVVPACIQGIRRICLSARLRERVLQDVVGRFAEKYRAVASYRDVWAPGNVVELAEAMGDLAAAPTVPGLLRHALASVLMGHLKNISIARILGRVFGAPEEAPAESAKLAGTFVDSVFGLLLKPEHQDPEDQRILVEALARVAGAKKIGTGKAESEDRRSRIVELLLERRDGSPALRSLLYRLRRSPHLPKALERRLNPAGERR